MPDIISLLKLEELSLVDNPANPLAMAPLYKRNAPKEGEIMTEETEMTEVEKKVEELEGSVETLKSENERLRKALIDNQFVITKDAIEKKAEPEFIEIEGEQVNKADIPAAVLKKMEADAAKADELALVEKAEEILPNVKKDHAKVLVKTLDTSDEEILEFLRSVDALFADKMDEVGKASTAEDLKSAEEKMEDLVKVYMEENKLPRKDYAKAYAAVAKTDEGKALVRETYKGDN